MKKILIIAIVAIIAFFIVMAFNSQNNKTQQEEYPVSSWIPAGYTVSWEEGENVKIFSEDLSWERNLSLGEEVFLPTGEKIILVGFSSGEENFSPAPLFVVK